MNQYEFKATSNRPITRSFGRDITNSVETPTTDSYELEIWQNLQARETAYMPSAGYMLH